MSQNTQINRHRPVMVNEVMALMDLRPGMVVVDGTVGSGGHSEIILKSILPGGQLIGIDQDHAALNRAKENLSGFGNSFVLVHENFSAINKVIKNLGISNIDRVLLDLGTSREQLESNTRGFSFMRDAALDMRMNTEEQYTAGNLVNKLTEQKLEQLFKEYGEEPFAKRIAKAIVLARRKSPIKTTVELAQIISRAVPKKVSRKKRIHPATRVFQALRIAVNKELENLSTGLEESYNSLSFGGRFCVLAYHSLEDRIVKEFFKKRLTLLTKKPIQPTREEVLANPSARSAKLRGALKEEVDILARFK